MAQMKKRPARKRQRAREKEGFLAGFLLSASLGSNGLISMMAIV